MTSDAGGQPYDADLMAAVTELGTALRELVDASVLTTVPADQLRAAAADARAVTARLAAAQRPVTQLPVLDDPLVFRRVYNPVSGVGSALAPPVRIRRVEGGVVGEALLGPAYEGPPGYVHGGWIALGFDEILGMANIASGHPGMTGRLSIRYRRPTPLHRPMVFEGWTDQVDGRRVVTRGTLTVDDSVTAEAEGLFVVIDLDRATEYFGERAYERRQAADPLP